MELIFIKIRHFSLKIFFESSALEKSNEVFLLGFC